MPGTQVLGTVAADSAAFPSKELLPEVLPLPWVAPARAWWLRGPQEQPQCQSGAAQVPAGLVGLQHRHPTVSCSPRPVLPPSVPAGGSPESDALCLPFSTSELVLLGTGMTAAARAAEPG